MRGLSEPIRILKDDLHVAAQPAQRSPSTRGTSWPSNTMRPDVGSISRMISRPVVDLPQPDLADEAKRLARVRA